VDALMGHVTDPVLVLRQRRPGRAGPVEVLVGVLVLAGRIGWLAERGAVDLDLTAEWVEGGVGMGVVWGRRRPSCWRRSRSRSGHRRAPRRAPAQLGVGMPLPGGGLPDDGRQAPRPERRPAGREAMGGHGGAMGSARRYLTLGDVVRRE